MAQLVLKHFLTFVFTLLIAISLFIGGESVVYGWRRRWNNFFESLFISTIFSLLAIGFWVIYQIIQPSTLYLIVYLPMSIIIVGIIYKRT